MEIIVGGTTVTGLVDTGAQRSVLNIPIGTASQNNTSIIGASGKATLAVNLKSQPVAIGSQVIYHEFLYIPECPIPLIGRDLLCKMQATLEFAPNGQVKMQSLHCRAPILLCPVQEAWRCQKAVKALSVKEKGVGEWKLINLVPGVWAENNPISLAVQAVPVRIILKPQARPVQVRQYPIPIEAKEPIQNHLARLLKLGVLIETASAWNTPLLPVKKPGTECDYRPVQDLRAVNESVLPMTPIVPNPYTLLGRIPGNSSVYTVVDLKDAFFSIPLDKDSIYLFAFTWEDVRTGITSQLSWTRLPQGFCHSPSIFSQQLNKDLEHWQETNGPLLLYVDDILLPCPDLNSCKEHTLSLLKELEQLGYRASQKKAQICQEEVEYLGFIIRKDQRLLSPARTKAITTLPLPRMKKELRTMLGMAGYCRIWILNFASITKPLYAMLQGNLPENVPLAWEPIQLKAIETLKAALKSPPALGIPDTTRPFKLFVDDRKGVALGMLTQILGSWDRPIAYLSKKLDTVSQGWPSCLRSIAATSLLLTEALKLTFGQTIYVTASHSIKNLLEKQGPRWMTSSRLVKYTAQLCENPNVTIQDQSTLNPATLMPVPEQELVHDCEEVMTKVYSSRPDLKDEPLKKGRILFCDGSSYIKEGCKVAGYAVVEQGRMVRNGKLPAGTSAHKAEIIALTQALLEATGQEVTIYTDSKNAFLTVQVHGALYKERGFLTSEGRPVAYASEIRALLDAVWKPLKVAVVHCKAHTKKGGPVPEGNAIADQEAKKAAISGPPVTRSFAHLYYAEIPVGMSKPYYSPEEEKEAQDYEFRDIDGWKILEDDRVWIPQSLAYEVLSKIHNQCHLGKINLERLARKTLYIDHLYKWCKLITKECLTCAQANPRRGPGLTLGTVLKGTRPFQVIQIDFTHMPLAYGFKVLLVAVCTYTGWIEARPATGETAAIVAKFLLEEVVPRYGLPLQINSDNGPGFANALVEHVSNALGLTWKLHCAWRPQSSGMVERANQTLKLYLTKLCIETKEKMYTSKFWLYSI
ncbi:protein NYNRIN-like [Rhineura floridana]|uniref:protein NYNRIN-like n=1 Tax=Rhineura floridana TaxID=261503 RepID=UPI002AC84EB5|nr:protein NYNRIN-like [Rhineura floridana]